jgi:hypothetical protein
LIKEVEKMAYGATVFEETVHKYPDVPRFIILKLDIQRRKLVYTDRLIEYVGHNHPGPLPPMILRDGTTVLAAPGEGFQDPYTIDYVDGKIGIYDGETFIDETEFQPQPAFFSKQTSSGMPMWAIAGARPQRIEILTSRFCQFWKEGLQCKFCFWNTMFKGRDGSLFKKTPDRQDVIETVQEALKEEGRFSQFVVTGGANQHGDEPFDDEVNQYIYVLQAIGENFSTRRFPSQVISSAFSKKQLKRIYDETGILSYCPDIEVWDEKLFKWMCPGKEKFIGRTNWMKSMFDAVEIFGEGNVYTNFVAGCEMVQPQGFKTEDAALKSNLEGCEYLAKQGVAMMGLVWAPSPGTVIQKQKQPSLDYYVRLAKGLHDIRAAYGLDVHSDDYKHCSNHADSDLCRIV